MKRLWIDGCISWWILTRCNTDYTAEKGTIDTVFILERLAENSRSKHNKFLLFVDLEKASEVIWITNGFTSRYQGRKLLFQSE